MSGAVGLAALACAATVRTTATDDLAEGYALMFLLAAGLALAIAVTSLLPRHRRHA